MSRGIEIIETCRPTGSSDTTISVSVRAWARLPPESTPISRMFSRSRSPGPGVEAACAVEAPKTRLKLSNAE